jgi:hypothetical protein
MRATLNAAGRGLAVAALAVVLAAGCGGSDPPAAVVGSPTPGSAAPTSRSPLPTVTATPRPTPTDPAEAARLDQAVRDADTALGAALAKLYADVAAITRVGSGQDNVARLRRALAAGRDAVQRRAAVRTARPVNCAALYAVSREATAAVQPVVATAGGATTAAALEAAAARLAANLPAARTAQDKLTAAIIANPRPVAVKNGGGTGVTVIRGAETAQAKAVAGAKLLRASAGELSGYAAGIVTQASGSVRSC